jgi:hypothetical protein
MAQPAVISIAELTTLPHLSLTNIIPDSDLGCDLWVLPQVLPRLQQLTHLTLVGEEFMVRRREEHMTIMDRRALPQPARNIHMPVCTNIFRALRCLPALQELQWGLPVGAAAFPEAMSGLQRLTWLQVEGSRTAHFTNGTVSFSNSILPSLAQLTALQRLGLKDADGFNPELLPSLTRLPHLEVAGTPLAGGPEGTAAFLSAVSGLQQLTYIQWADDMAASLTDEHEWAALMQDYAALTASSVLQELTISLPYVLKTDLSYFLSGIGPVPADRGLAVHMFPSGRHLPHLRVLHLGGGPVGDRGMISAVVSACPALEELHLTAGSIIALADQQLPFLVKLPQLTKLSLPSVDSPEGAVAALAQLTQLKQLSVVELAPHMMCADLSQPLTVLTRLHKLHWGSERVGLPGQQPKMISLDNTVRIVWSAT